MALLVIIPYDELQERDQKLINDLTVGWSLKFESENVAGQRMKVKTIFELWLLAEEFYTTFLSSNFLAAIDRLFSNL